VVLSGDQPGPGNTGVPAGTVLTVMNGDLTITKAGAVYSGLDIHGFVKVEAPNVTIKNSIIRGGVAPADIGLVNDTDNSATNFLIEDSELVPMDPSVQIDGIKGWNYTALRLDIHGTTDGAKMYGPNATIEDSYIHGLVTYAHDPDHGGGQSHNDGVQILSGSNLKIIGNTIEGGSNTALMVTQDHGTTSGVMFANNWVSGGACTLNILPTPMASLGGISVDNNIFTDNSTKHCPILDSPHTDLSASGNVFAGSGAPVPINNKGGS
jgi:Right handed beta helix region